MKISNNYKNAFTEVYTILQYLEDDDLAKIPKSKIEVIKENRNKDYEYSMNEDVDIFKQEMLPETKAILFNFFRDYLCTETQRKKIYEMQRKERWQAELDKKKRFENKNS